MTIFPTDAASIRARLAAVDPRSYARTRNYIDGSVSRLSPYISRGFLSTREVLHSLQDRGFRTSDMEKFIQELAWREYWQRIWIQKGDLIETDPPIMRPGFRSSGIPSALVEGATGIDAIDMAVRDLYSTGYMHNHTRMYVAMTACNIGNCHWLTPARWMYYHLLDADWASNLLSWQWVAGAYIDRKYIANQENIDRFCGTRQKGTFLDKDYNDLMTADVPEILQKIIYPYFSTWLPETCPQKPPINKPACVYTLYNLDPDWRKDQDATRILLLEPSLFNRFPMAHRTIDFICSLASNIPGIQIYAGEFDDWFKDHQPGQVFFKEHPTNRHFRGCKDARDWLFPAEKVPRSFSAFWQAVRHEIIY